MTLALNIQCFPQLPEMKLSLPTSQKSIALITGVVIGSGVAFITSQESPEESLDSLAHWYRLSTGYEIDSTKIDSVLLSKRAQQFRRFKSGVLGLAIGIYAYALLRLTEL